MQLQVLNVSGGFILDEILIAAFGTAAATYGNTAAIALPKKLFLLPNQILQVTGAPHLQVTIAECDSAEEALAVRIT